MTSYNHKAQIGIRTTQRLREELERIAENQGSTLTQVCQEALESYAFDLPEVKKLENENGKLSQKIKDLEEEIVRLNEFIDQEGYEFTCKDEAVVALREQNEALREEIRELVNTCKSRKRVIDEMGEKTCELEQKIGDIKDEMPILNQVIVYGLARVIDLYIHNIWFTSKSEKKAYAKMLLNAFYDIDWPGFKNPNNVELIYKTLQQEFNLKHDWSLYQAILKETRKYNAWKAETHWKEIREKYLSHVPLAETEDEQDRTLD